MQNPKPHAWSTGLWYYKVLCLIRIQVSIEDAHTQLHTFDEKP